MQTMKDILNRMLNHEELTREETKNILIGITKREFSLSYSTTNGKRGEEIMIYSDNLKEIEI